MVEVKKHVDVDGSEYWTNKLHKQLIEIKGPDLHREDGPAVIRADGSKAWCRYGTPHREDGPAIITANGIEQWWLNGMCHREDGPAVINTNGNKQWWLNGHQYSFNEWLQALNISAEEKAILKLKYG